MKKQYTVEKKMIPSFGKDIKILILRPTTNAKPREHTPGILWIHGGGYATGMAGMIYMSRALDLVKKYGAVVVTPEYRLAGRHPYPAGLADCYAALKYIKDYAEKLGINSSQIMVGGESAGGGLTAALCMYAKDKGEVNIAFQMPLYPMIDDQDTESSRDNYGISWNTRRNHAAWKLYLRRLKKREVSATGSRGDSKNVSVGGSQADSAGTDKCRAVIPSYAAPARRKDYTGLPPAYTFVGEHEAFYCETLTYIDNLQKAGIPAHVDIYPTGLHAFDMLLPFLPMSKHAARIFEERYLYAAENYFAKQD